MKYYFRELDRQNNDRYSRISSSTIYESFHSFVCNSLGLVSEDYRKFSGMFVGGYDLSADLEFNRVDDLCKNNKWEI